MRVTFNNNAPAYKSQNMTIIGKYNRKVPYLYNKVLDSIKGMGVPATFNMGADVITLSPATKSTAKFLKRDLNEKGIRISKPVKKAENYS